MPTCDPEDQFGDSPGNVAGERLDALRKFITQHKLKQHLAFYQTQRKQKPWICRFNDIQQTLK